MEIQSPLLPIVGPPPRRKRPSPIPKVVVFLLIVAAVAYAGNRLWRAMTQRPSFAAVAAPSLTSSTPSAPGQPLGVGHPGSPSAEPPRRSTPAENGTAQPPVGDSQAARAVGPRRLAITIGGPLETSLVEAVGADLGRSLAQVLTRSLVWWLAVPGDLRRGDKLEALFEERRDQEPMVHFLRFTSAKMGQTFAAYRFKPSGASFARFFQPSGEELELRLKEGPLEDYEQVTSLINDGRHHKGVDFKTPVGTKVRATFDGTVKRKTWHFRGNGNSLEIAENGPPYRTAIFLHLSPLSGSMHVGRQVKKGEMIAASGNSGRSFAPHLHYQLMQGQKLLNPFRIHTTYRKSLSADDRLALNAEIHRLDNMSVAIAGK